MGKKVRPVFHVKAAEAKNHGSNVEGVEEDAQRIIAKLKNLCPDCAVEPDAPHDEGCDVAKCTVCGAQHLFHGQHEDAPMQIWTGKWPGDEEIEEGLAKDHNDLFMKSMTDELEWNGQRWVAKNKPPDISHLLEQKLYDELIKVGLTPTKAKEATKELSDLADKMAKEIREKREQTQHDGI